MFLSVLSVDKDVSAVGNVRQIKTACHNTALAYE